MSMLSWTPYNKFISLAMLVCFGSACSSGKLKHERVSLSHDQELSGEGSFYNSDHGKNVLKKYCDRGKQIREFKINVKFIAPKAPKGIPADDAGKILGEILNRKSCYIQGAFWFTSNIRSCSEELGHDDYLESYNNCRARDDSELGRWTEDSEAEIAEYAKNLRVPVSGMSVLSVNPIFLGTSKNKKLFFIFDVPEKGEWFGKTKYAGTYSNGGDIGVKKMFLSELNILKTDYTMLLPKDFQTQYFGEHRTKISELVNEKCEHIFPKSLLVNQFNKHASSASIWPDSNTEYLGYSDGCFGRTCDPDADKVISNAAAVDHREAIWLSYILAFTSMKESAQDDAQTTDYELNLNLEPFCKYGRPVSDFLSH